MLVNETMDARGFNQWKQAGRYVKKGTKAFYILAPRMIKVEETNKETGQKELIPVLGGFLGIPVFKYEDTDGQPLPELEPKKLPELFDIAAKIGLKVEYRENSGLPAWGYYSPSLKQIVLYTHDAATFYHELTHAVQDYLEKLKPVNRDSEEYKLNEVIAELSAAVIANLYGSKVDAQAYSYIKYYANMLETTGTNNDKVYKSILKVLGKVETILNFIFSAKVETEPVKETITAWQIFITVELATAGLSSLRYLRTWKLRGLKESAAYAS